MNHKHHPRKRTPLWLVLTLILLWGGGLCFLPYLPDAVWIPSTGVLTALTLLFTYLARRS